MSGALNGNVGIVKSVLAEITDDSNVARAFSLLPLSFVIGQVIGFGLSITRLFLLLMVYRPRQVFCWWLLTATTRSLARILPSTLLGRIPIFPPMSDCGFLFPHSVHYCRDILRRGCLITALITPRLIHDQDARSQAFDDRENKLTTRRYRRAATTTTLPAHKTCRNFNYKLRNPRLARNCSFSALTSRLVDRDRVRRTRPNPGLYRSVDVRIRLCERCVPIRVFPARRCTVRPRAPCLRQRRRIRLTLRAVPVREYARAWYSDSGSRMATYRAAAHIDGRFRHGIQ
jgi:hypothetical protein